MLPGPLERIPERKPITWVSADEGRACRDAIVDPDAEAVIPPWRSAKPWKKGSPGAAGRDEASGAIDRLGRTICRRRKGDRRRRRVEIRMACTRPLGQKPTAVRHRLRRGRPRAIFPCLRDGCELEATDRALAACRCGAAAGRCAPRAGDGAQ
jgi:hypothetical protein